MSISEEKKMKLNGNNLGKAIKNNKPTNSNSMSTTLIKEPNLQSNRQIKGEETKVVEVEEAEVKPTKGLSENIQSLRCQARTYHQTMHLVRDGQRIQRATTRCIRNKHSNSYKETPKCTIVATLHAHGQWATFAASSLATTL
jgi:hypothetical protein